MEVVSSDDGTCFWVVPLDESVSTAIDRHAQRVEQFERLSHEAVPGESSKIRLTGTCLYVPVQQISPRFLRDVSALTQRMGLSGGTVHIQQSIVYTILPAI